MKKNRKQWLKSFWETETWNDNWSSLQKYWNGHKYPDESSFHKSEKKKLKVFVRYVNSIIMHTQLFTLQNRSLTFFFLHSLSLNVDTSRTNFIYEGSTSLGTKPITHKYIEPKLVTNTYMFVCVVVERERKRMEGQG